MELLISTDGAHLEITRLMRVSELGLLCDGSDYLRDGGFWQARYMLDLGLIIGGGTAQIQTKRERREDRLATGL